MGSSVYLYVHCNASQTEVSTAEVLRTQHELLTLDFLDLPPLLDLVFVGTPATDDTVSIGLLNQLMRLRLTCNVSISLVVDFVDNETVVAWSTILNARLYAADDAAQGQQPWLDHCAFDELVWRDEAASALRLFCDTSSSADSIASWRSRLLPWRQHEVVWTSECELNAPIHLIDPNYPCLRVDSRHIGKGVSIVRFRSARAHNNSATDTVLQHISVLLNDTDDAAAASLLQKGDEDAHERDRPLLLIYRQTAYALASSDATLGLAQTLATYLKDSKDTSNEDIECAPVHSDAHNQTMSLSIAYLSRTGALARAKREQENKHSRVPASELDGALTTSSTRRQYIKRHSRESASLSEHDISGGLTHKRLRLPVPESNDPQEGEAEEAEEDESGGETTILERNKRLLHTQCRLVVLERLKTADSPFAK